MPRSTRNLWAPLHVKMVLNLLTSRHVSLSEGPYPTMATGSFETSVVGSKRPAIRLEFSTMIFGSIPSAAQLMEIEATFVAFISSAMTTPF